MSMTFEEFHERATPARGGFDEYDHLSFWSNGLGGEAGETVEAVLDLLNLMLAVSKLQNTAKKLERDGESDVLREAMRSESGDTLFYLRHALERCGLTMQDAADACLEKLDRIRTQESVR